MFEKISTILQSRHDNLLLLAEEIGADPKSFFKGASLAGADITDLDLRGIDFSGADFSGAIYNSHTKVDAGFIDLLKQGKFVESSGANDEEAAFTSAEDLLSLAGRKAAMQATSKVAQDYIADVMSIRERFPLDTSQLVSETLKINSDIPTDIRNKISVLQEKIRIIILEVATEIEEKKYKRIREEITHLSALQEQRLDKLLSAEKKVHISLQTVKLTMDVFTEMNQRLVDDITKSDDNQDKFRLLIANAILVYEMTGFLIEYIEAFDVEGINDIHTLESAAMERIGQIRKDIDELKRKVEEPDINDGVKKTIQSNIENNWRTTELMETAWNKYVSEMKKKIDIALSVRSSLPTLRLLREDARIRLDLVEQAIILDIMRDTSMALESARRSADELRLAPLSPEETRLLIR